MNSLYRNKQLELQSTNYLHRLHFPTNDYHSEQSDQSISELSNQQVSSLSYQCQTEDLNENITVNSTHISQNIHLISSFAKPSQLNLLKSIDHNKNKYNQLLKTKQQNRQKFIQKINQNLTDSHSLFLSSNPSTHQFKPYHNPKQITSNNQRQPKIPRSQTQQNKSKPNLSIKDSSSNWDKNSQIDFNLTSQRQGSAEKVPEKSANKKITIKRKNSTNSSVKGKHELKTKNNQQKDQKNDQTDKKDSTLNKSVNEFLFFQQYQKDNKQIMSRLLTIIEQEHMNRFAKGYENQNEVNEEKALKTKQRSCYASGKHQINNIETEFSSIKPIVINNYIKSPTQFMGKGLIEREMTIKMLEQNRNHKKSMLNSVAESRILTESAIAVLPSKQDSGEKKKNHQQQSLKSINKRNPQQSASSDIERTQKANHKDQDELDFELLYNKLKNQAEKQHKISQNQTQSNKIDETQQPSEIILPIESSRQTQSVSVFPSAQTTNLKTFATHNVSQSFGQFNPNTSIQSHQIQTVYNFKKPSFSMQIAFGNQDKPKQNISLADAFKKKFGAAKFGAKQKNRQIKEALKSTEALSQLKGIQNKITSSHQKDKPTDDNNKNKKQNPSGRKTVKISKKGTSIRDKQNINFVQTPRNLSENNLTDRSVGTKLSKEPSKQLLDRLIYGQKATMTKKQMYELSKKNYMKLPEIEQKKKQQQKRLKQLERKLKIKEYQKRIRSSKNSLCKASLESSFQLE